MDEQGPAQLSPPTRFERLRQQTVTMADWVACCFECIWDIWTVLKLCRFNVLLPIVVWLFLRYGPNGQDILLRMLQDFPQRTSLKVAFLVVLPIWGFTVWYWARVILSFRFRNWPPRLTAEDAGNHKAEQAHAERIGRILFWHAQVPRICGVGAMAGVAAALFHTSREMGDDLEGWWKSAAWAFVVMAVVSLFIWNRRRIVRFLFRRFLGEPSADDRRDPLSFFYEGKEPAGFYERLTNLPGSTMTALALSLAVLSIGPFLIIVNREWNLMLAPDLGAPTILLLAASAWIPVGAILTYWSNHYRVPVFISLFGYVTLMSVFNDNHRVRDVAVESRPRSTVEQRFDAWIEHRKVETGADHAGGRRGPIEIPVFVVTAEGGGIRAAYWTATLLAKIQETRSEFAAHVFAISGVSGGSLGAAVFDALLAEQEMSGSCQFKIVDCARRVLRKDFVAPTLATMLYPDLVQRFLPMPMQQLGWDWDRATTLEAAWEKAWRDETKNGRFGDPFESLWANDAREQQVPNLFLNSTSVERGNRVLTSNLNIQKSLTECPEVVKGTTGSFHDVTDFHVQLNACAKERTGLAARTVRLSTAAHNSARFTYVSPAGTVHPNLHIVDGAYFENSGATTADEIINLINVKKEDLKRQGVMLLPMFIHIANEPEAIVVTGTIAERLEGGIIKLKPETDGLESTALGGSLITAFVDEGKRRLSSKVGTLQQGERVTLELDRANNVLKIIDVHEIRVLPETLSPVLALLHTQVARATYAVDVVRARVEPDPRGPENFFHFGLKKSVVHPPLGWALSRSSWEEIDGQLETYFLGCRDKDEHGRALKIEEYFRKCWP